MQSKRFIYLDGLRGYAAFAVFIGHFLGTFYPIPIPNVAGERLLVPLLELPLVRLFLNGQFAVCVFFVLSGFVLTHKFFVTHQHLPLLAITKRYFRLVVPILGSILIAYIILKLGWFKNQQAAQLSLSTWAASAYQFKPNFGQALYQAFVDVFGQQQYRAIWYNPVLWTMKVEFFGSMLVFGLVLILGLLKRLGHWPALVVFGLAALMFWHTYYLGFVIGALFAYGAAQGWLQWLGQRLNVRRTALLLSLGGVMFIDYYYPSLSSPGYQIAALTLGAASLMASCLLWPRLQEILSLSASRFLGHNSYALYLMHFIVLMSFSSWLYVMARAAQVPNGLALVGVFSLSIPVLLISSALFTKYCDQPAIIIANKVGSNIVQGLLRTLGLIRSIPHMVK